MERKKKQNEKYRLVLYVPHVNKYYTLFININNSDSVDIVDLGINQLSKMLNQSLNLPIHETADSISLIELKNETAQALSDYTPIPKKT